MTDSDFISLEDFLQSLTRRPGLLLGSGATCFPGSLENVRHHAEDLSQEPNTGDPLQGVRRQLDQLRQSDPDKAARFEVKLKDDIFKLRPSLDISILAKVGWSACISLTFDLLFEEALQNYLDTIAASRPKTIIDNPSVRPPRATMPIYKLLGNLRNSASDSTLALAESDRLLRQLTWPDLLATLPDYLREAPLVIIGVEGIVDSVRVVLSTLMTPNIPCPSRVYFLAGDPTADDPTIRSLCTRSGIVQIDATLRELCSGIDDLKPQQWQLELATMGSDKTPIDRVVRSHQALISRVNPNLANKGECEQHPQAMRDSLFRPTSIDLAPFHLDMDIRRTCTDQLIEAVAYRLRENRGDHPESVVLIGEAGVGKTTCLKRVALELAKDDVVVLWCKRSVSLDWHRQFRQFRSELQDIMKTKVGKNLSVVLICDDPWYLRLDAGDLLSVFHDFKGRFAILFGLRTTDFALNDDSYGSRLRIATEVRLPYELDDSELESLQSMLIQIGYASDEDNASKQVKSLKTENASDILCSLWYLIPETQAQIADSLRDEYSRLGQPTDCIASVAKGAANRSEVAKKAYEFVTVSSNLNIGLPIEVLVRALKIDYSEWLDMCADGKPLWGLLYDEKDDVNDTVVFLTRNEVVTKVLRNLLNGGVGYAGELRALRELFAACESGTAVYRAFILDVLQNCRSKLEEVFSYLDGLSLYEIAQSTLPYEDRTLEHQKGVWMHHMGKDFDAAYKQLERAKNSPPSTQVENDAPIEHIHTSMAAVVVKKVQQGTQTPSTGLSVVKNHLNQASNAKFFNSYTAHVFARLLFELAEADTSLDQVVRLESLGEALKEIENTFQLIGSPGRNDYRNEKSIALLSDLQRQILNSISDDEELGRLANQLFNDHKNQIGFVAIARQKLVRATVSDKGKEYNKVRQYLNEIINQIESQGGTVDVELYVIRIDLVTRWHLQKPAGSVDWNEFHEDLDRVLSAHRYRDDALRTFYLAVALYHLGDTTNSRAKFHALRQQKLFSLQPKKIRCYLLGSEGLPKRVQATLEYRHSRYYLLVSELDTDILLDDPPDRGSIGETLHCWIGFSLNGPVAIFKSPREAKLLLP